MSDIEIIDGGRHHYRPRIADVEVAEAIERAADIITELGWCKHQSVDDRGRVCGSSALQLAIGDKIVDEKTWDGTGTFKMLKSRSSDIRTNKRNRILFGRCTRTIERFGLGGDDLIMVNDSQRTRNKIVAAFRRTAREIRNGAIEVVR